MNFENIAANNGFDIALTGIVIVFVALTLISIFIALLPKILNALAFALPPEDTSSPPPRSAGSSGDEIAVAVGYAMHKRKTEKKGGAR
jgi:oxaloacetate decarboxylase gamma subunit